MVRLGLQRNAFWDEAIAVGTAASKKFSGKDKKAEETDADEAQGRSSRQILQVLEFTSSNETSSSASLKTASKGNFEKSHNLSE
ncbi:MAG TPA: hypothetical protein VI636_14265 [Candidatus Angelobacter sp.]